MCMQVYMYRKCILFSRQRLLLYYNTFLRLSTEIHMKYLAVPTLWLLSISSLHVRVSRTYVCIFMKMFFIKTGHQFHFMYIVYNSN